MMNNILLKLMFNTPPTPPKKKKKLQELRMGLPFSLKERCLKKSKRLSLIYMIKMNMSFT